VFYCLGLGLKLWFGSGLRLAFLKDLCDNNEHQKLAYNLGGKFDIPAKKRAGCTVTASLLARLEVLVG